MAHVCIAEQDGTFLVRESSGDWVLSLVYDSKVYHYKIQKSSQGYNFYGNVFSVCYLLLLLAI